MRALLLLAALLPAGCAGAPAPPIAAPAPLPPLARAALEEWRAWGGFTIEGFPEVRPEFVPATEERFERLAGYWRATPGGGAVAARLEARRVGLLPAAEAQPVGDGKAEPAGEARAILVSAAVAALPREDIGHYARPFWSAAFVSAVARRAGLDVPPSATHARYVDTLLVRAVTDPDGAGFLPFDPAERALRPGDLLCADRSAAPLLHWRERLAEAGRPRPMHCDIVVRAAPGAIEAVGGNVQDVVALRRLPADAEGRVLPAPMGRSRFFVVLAARGG